MKQFNNRDIEFMKQFFLENNLKLDQINLNNYYLEFNSTIF